jgi:uncharacterized protein YcfJ
MTSDTKKVFTLLGGALGIALIAVGATLVIQKISQPAPPPPAPPAPVVAPQPEVPVAQIISVKPHYEDVSEPHKSCKQVAHVVYEQHQSAHPIVGAAVGGVAGGMIGHSIGGNSNAKLIASAAGAAIGAVSGNYVQRSLNKPQPETVYSTVCSTYKTTKHEQKGYEVTYLYQGQQSTVIMAAAPVGTTLTLPIQGVIG